MLDLTKPKCYDPITIDIMCLTLPCIILSIKPFVIHNSNCTKDNKRIIHSNTLVY